MKMNMTWNNIQYMPILIAIVWLLGACHQEDMEAEKDADSSVYLAAAIEEQIVSRVAYELTTPTQEKPLFASIWASSISREYPDKGKNGADGEVALHTSVRFESGNPQLLDAVIYPKKNQENNQYPPVYFIGLYPKSDSWSVEGDSLKASLEFTGKEDVMFAPEIFGHYDISYDDSPEFVFEHLLTLLKVKMIADSVEVKNAWGQIQSMKITTQNRVTIDLSRTYDATCLNYTGDGVELPLYKTGKDEVLAVESAPFDLPYKRSDSDQPEEVAYVLCSPVNDTDQGVEPLAEYMLTIETDRRKVVIPVDLKSF